MYIYTLCILGKGWQYVWGKGSKSYSEMIIKSYVCEHRRSNNELSPVSVALIHRFGTVNLSSVDAQGFKNNVTRYITMDGEYVATYVCIS